MYDTIKRVMDIIDSVILIVVFSPIMLLTAIIIKVTSPGPALVEPSNSHMKRLGKNGKVFRLFKFRSMPVKSDVLERTTPEYRIAYIEKHSSGNYKPKNDPRVTPFGKIIRKFSIDEMPQLFNVLRGDMSLIGPRPYLREELNEQQQKFPGTEKYVKKMLTVKPGITGYWQVSGRSDVNFDRRVEMDANYATKKSLLMDLYIILKTPFVMVSGRGAV